MSAYRLAIAATGLLVVTLVMAAAAKAVSPRAFQLQILEGTSLPVWLAAGIACLLPPAEIAIAAQLGVPRWRYWGAVQAIILVSGFAGWQSGKLIAGHEACGCFGAWLRYPPAVGLVIAIALGVAALVVARREAGADRRRWWPRIALVMVGAAGLGWAPFLV